MYIWTTTDHLARKHSGSAQGLLPVEAISVLRATDKREELVYRQESRLEWAVKWTVQERLREQLNYQKQERQWFERIRKCQDPWHGPTAGSEAEADE